MRGGLGLTCDLANPACIKNSDRQSPYLENADTHPLPFQDDVRIWNQIYSATKGNIILIKTISGGLGHLTP